MKAKTSLDIPSIVTREFQKTYFILFLFLLFWPGCGEFEKRYSIKHYGIWTSRGYEHLPLDEALAQVDSIRDFEYLRYDATLIDSAKICTKELEFRQKQREQKYGCRIDGNTYLSSDSDGRNYIAEQRVTIEYESYSYLAKKKAYAADVQMLTTGEFEREKGLIPLGGQVVVNIKAHCIEAGNTKWFSVIVEQNGERILKKTGKDSIDSIPRGRVNSYGRWGTITTWHNIMIVNLPKIADGPFRVYVIDSFNNKRYEYNIIPKTGD